MNRVAFVLFALAVGALAFALTPAEPRWSVRAEGEYHPRLIDGDTKVVTGTAEVELGPWVPVLRDAATGRKLSWPPALRDGLSEFALSPDGRRAAGLTIQDFRLVWFDLATGRGGERPLPRFTDMIAFARGGRVVVAMGVSLSYAAEGEPAPPPPPRLLAVDMLTGVTVHLGDAEPLAFFPSPGTDVSADRRFAVTATADGRLVQGWDVPARRPWTWAIAAPLALLGFAVLGRRASREVPA